MSEEEGCLSFSSYQKMPCLAFKDFPSILRDAIDVSIRGFYNQALTEVRGRRRLEQRNWKWLS